MYCPVDLNFEFYGHLVTSKSKSMSLTVDRCTEQNKLVKDLPCASQKEIDNWISSTFLNHMHAHDIID
jgi:hypothetical protein